MRVFLKLGWFFRQQWRAYGLAIAMLCGVAALEMVPPWIIGQTVDQITSGSLVRGELFKQIAIILVVAVAIYLLRFLWRVYLFGSSIKLAALLRERLFRHFTRMSPEFYQRYRTGDLMARSTNDIQAVEATAGEGVLTLVDSLLTGALVLIILITQISWELTLFALLPMPVMAFFINRYGTQLHGHFGRAQEAFSALNDKVQESLGGVRVIKAFAREEREAQAFGQHADQAYRHNLAVARIDARFDPTIFLAIGCSFFLSVAGGGYLVAQQQLTLGQLTSFTMYLGYLIWPMLALAWMFNIVERGSAAWSRIESLLDEQPSINPDTGQPLPETDLTLQFDRVTFKHPASAHNALEGIDFTLDQGHTLGLVGRTGAGKTSLIQLLLRGFDPDAGHIQLAGHDLRHWPLEQLRRQLAYVPQEPFLFSTTIAENIALGKPGASMDEIREAARLACLDQEIEHFPDGYATEVGERGVTLSGGQKQRLAIARALLMDAPILLLDDALSAVDGQTEHQILTNLRQVRQDRTAIICAHRLSAVADAEQILVLEQGTIGERGDHASLMAANGWYADMYRYQQIDEEIQQGMVNG